MQDRYSGLEPGLVSHHLRGEWLHVTVVTVWPHLVAGVQGLAVPGPDQDGQRVAAPGDALQAHVGAQVERPHQRGQGDVMVIIDHWRRRGH